MKKKPEPQQPKPIVTLPVDIDTATIVMVREAGYLPILTEHPDKVRVIHASCDIVAGDMLMSAMMALSQVSSSSCGRDMFVQELWRRIKAKEGKA